MLTFFLAWFSSFFLIRSPFSSHFIGAESVGKAKQERETRKTMKNIQKDTREIEINKQREELNKLLEIDPEVLREVHGGAGCDCCKWEANVA
jgi:hypothetical protein